jgi:hypothetical protein
MRRKQRGLIYNKSFRAGCPRVSDTHTEVSLSLSPLSLSLSLLSLSSLSLFAECIFISIMVHGKLESRKPLLVL